MAHAPNALPSIVLSVPSTGTVGVAVVADLSGSTDSDNRILRWIVSWGDETGAQGNGQPDTVSHVYTQAGTYTVFALVQDVRGGRASTQAAIVVT